MKQWVTELFGRPKALVGMIHVGALPGTPWARDPVAELSRRAAREAQLLAAEGFDAVMIENMHDRPYLRQSVGPEIVAAMTAVLDEVRQAVEVPIGVQILAGANSEALAVAFCGGAAFIRAENFVYAHVADEGLMDRADAGPLLRYRRELGAERIRILADVKKKHASHTLTVDLEADEVAQAAAFFGADGVVVTGSVTGRPADVLELRQVTAAVEVPVAIGSGLTAENLPEYWPWADLFIVGSFIKHDGRWDQPPDRQRVRRMVKAARELRARDESIP